MSKPLYIAHIDSSATTLDQDDEKTHQRNQASMANKKQSDNVNYVMQRELVTIFDWDDTLFPTHDVYKTRCNLSVEQLHAYGRLMYTVLCRYVQLCGHQNVYIVTNGIRGWVRKSLHHLCHEYNIKLHQQALQPQSSHLKTNYFQLVFQLLFDQAYGFPITVCSARYIYETMHRTLPISTAVHGMSITAQWKLFTFKFIFQQRCLVSKVSHLQILCVGDGNDEYEASLSTKHWLQTQVPFKQSDSSLKCHRIKLHRNPSVATMYYQLVSIYKDVAQCFNVAADSKQLNEWNVDFAKNMQSHQIKQQI